MPSRPSAAPNMSCATSAVTPTAWPSATTASPLSTANTSASAGAIMPTVESSASHLSAPWSSCADSSCMSCPGTSCASATTACCRTASANNCCPWPEHCSQHRVANRFRPRPCPNANSGTVHAAVNPSVWSSASPPHNSISQASIPHDRICQPGPPACTVHVFAGVCAKHAEHLHNHVQQLPQTARLQTVHAVAHPLPSTSATTAATKCIYSIAKRHSISISKSQTPAPAANACAFLPPSKSKPPRLYCMPSHGLRAQGVSDLG